MNRCVDSMTGRITVPAMLAAPLHIDTGTTARKRYTSLTFKIMFRNCGQWHSLTSSRSMTMVVVTTKMVDHPLEG